jgi:peptidoglycan/xylan/chitin deacetylase (PgdA/CDA1 family)
LKGLLSILLALVSLTFPCRECLSGDESHRVYACGKSDGNELALTFDDGPHPEYTPQILDILKNNGVKATFFVIGKNAELYPELVERMVREGHTVGNHTYAHRPIHEQKEEGFYRDVLKNRSLLSGFSVKDGLFRPPGGVCDEKVLALGKKLDYDVILWTVDTEDWKAPATERIVNAVLQNVKGGDIILMHDYVAGQSNTPAALEELLPALLEKGYTFLTVDQLLLKD